MRFRGKDHRINESVGTAVLNVPWGYGYDPGRYGYGYGWLGSWSSSETPHPIGVSTEMSASLLAFINNKKRS